MSGAIHFILQGKGGVGKSLVAALLAQYLQRRDVPSYCADTDPVNRTFSRYKAFSVDRIDLFGDDDNKIDTRAFDELIEKLVKHEGNAVIDNGAATFVPLTGYLEESQLLAALIEQGKQVYLHSVLTGGQALKDTTIGLQTLLRTQQAPVIVWENEYFGAIERDGAQFSESQLFKANQSRIHGLVRIEQRTRDTYGKDMEILASNHLTFEEGKTSGKFSFAALTRLKQMQAEVFSQLDSLSV